LNILPYALILWAITLWYNYVDEKVTFGKLKIKKRKQKQQLEGLPMLSNLELMPGTS